MFHLRDGDNLKIPLHVWDVVRAKDGEHLLEAAFRNTIACAEYHPVAALLVIYFSYPQAPKIKHH